MNHLEYYKECLETGLLKGTIKFWGTYRNGLCNDPEIDKELLKLFRPNGEESDDDIHWAEDRELEHYTLGLEFGPTRQNIVLFIAAIKGEL